jgi:hypothetical protein
MRILVILRFLLPIYTTSYGSAHCGNQEISWFPQLTDMQSGRNRMSVSTGYSKMTNWISDLHAEPAVPNCEEPKGPLRAFLILCVCRQLLERRATGKREKVWWRNKMFDPWSTEAFRVS